MLRGPPGALAFRLWHTQLPGHQGRSQPAGGSHDFIRMPTPKSLPPPGSPLGSGFQGCGSGVGVKEAARPCWLSGPTPWQGAVGGMGPMAGIANRGVPIWLTCQVEPASSCQTPGADSNAPRSSLSLRTAPPPDVPTSDQRLQKPEPIHWPLAN